MLNASLVKLYNQHNDEKKEKLQILFPEINIKVLQAYFVNIGQNVEEILGFIKSLKKFI